MGHAIRHAIPPAGRGAGYPKQRRRLPAAARTVPQVTPPLLTHPPPAAMRPTAPLPGGRRGAEARPGPTLPPQPPHTAGGSRQRRGRQHRGRRARPSAPAPPRHDPTRQLPRALPWQPPLSSPRACPVRAAGRNLPPTGRRAGRKDAETAALPRAAWLRPAAAGRAERTGWPGRGRGGQAGGSRRSFGILWSAGPESPWLAFLQSAGKRPFSSRPRLC